MTDFIYLASQSPRRKQLLEQWGVRCELLLPDASEDAESLEVVLPGEAPAAYVKRVTNLKLAASVARLKRRGLPLAPVLCADTTVALGRRILGKPADAAEASAMLTDLAGKRHRVLTAVAVGQTGAARGGAAVGGFVHILGSLRAADRRANQALCGQRRAHGQGGCLCDSGSGGPVGQPDQRELLRHHGLARV